MSQPSTLSKKEIRRRAFAEAAALLASDCDGSDLQADADQEITGEDADRIREYIRVVIVSLLEERGSR